jgi:SAM-dependent methyltransferase
MIKQATSSTEESNVSFRQASSEELGFIEDGTLDMAVAGQAAHWFDYGKVWPELQRKLRKGGVVAFWGYKDNVFVNYPKATKILDHYCYGLGPELMGQYWEQPGRNILRGRLAAIKPPESVFEDITRVEYEPGTSGPNTGSLGERLMHRKFKLGEMEGYARTFSAYVNWAEAHPDRKPKELGGQGDVIDDMFDAMRQAEPDFAAMGESWRELEVDSEWGSIILMARKK